MSVTAADGLVCVVPHAPVRATLTTYDALGRVTHSARTPSAQAPTSTYRPPDS
ncbi:hypothetical protein [Streptomyces sp. NPDC058695]|uniref:hypothetical protein n=1 Tax=Streptomyces sp. NPDC058695 TaxID=3346604 RepID=UPI00364AC42B